jgi:hypothetical protein
MIFALLAALACVPNTVAWTPTPVLVASEMPLHTVAVRLYWKNHTSTTWHLCASLPVQYDEDARPMVPLLDLAYPVQRCLPDGHEGYDLDWAAAAFKIDGTETERSNAVEICQPYTCPTRGPCP